MKILYYSPNPSLCLDSPSGYGTHMREMINAFRGLGHSVREVVRGGVALRGVRSKTFNAKLKTFAKTAAPKIVWETAKDINLAWFDYGSYIALLKQIHEFKPDMIYERGNYLQLSGVTAAKKLGIPHVLEFNAPFVQERSSFSPFSLIQYLAPKVENRQVSLTGRVVVVSSALREFVIDVYKINPLKVIVTPNAINLEDIRILPSLIASTKRRFDLDGKIVLGFVGSLFKWHGIDILVRAFAKVYALYPNVRLMIVGDGFLRTELEQLAAKLGLSNKVVFTGQVPHEHVFSFIEIMDIAVMASSNWYGSPVKLFEYGAMSKPIIAPDTGPVRDVMVSGEDGILVSADVHDLFRAIIFTIDNPGNSAAAARRFHDKVVKNHLWVNNARASIDGSVCSPCQVRTGVSSG